MKQIIVLNQAALPRGMAGGTRHVELFERLQGWSARVVAGNRSYLSQEIVHADGVLVPVRVSEFHGNGVSRVINWLSYMASAFAYSMRATRPQVVWGSSPQMGAAVVGLAVARFRRAPFVLEVRDLWPHILVEAGVITENSWVHRCIRGIEEYLYRSAVRIVVLAEGTGRELQERGFDDGKVVFLPNGADLGQFVLNESRDDLRDEFRFEGFTLVYAGAHGPANGLDLVVDAAEELDARKSACRFVLVGDGVEKPGLQARVRDAGLTNVTFMDPIPKSEIPRLYAAADAGLHCLDDVDLFKYGVSPNKLYDYMAAGLPVVTNAGGDVAAMVERAESGIACGPRMIADAAHTLSISSSTKLDAWSLAGRRFMEEHRSRDALADQLEMMLEEVLSES